MDIILDYKLQLTGSDALETTPQGTMIDQHNYSYISVQYNMMWITTKNVDPLTIPLLLLNTIIRTLCDFNVVFGQISNVPSVSFLFADHNRKMLMEWNI